MASKPKVKRGRPAHNSADLMAAKSSILQAAAQVFDRSDEEAPVEEVLKEAQISRATFYKHFTSKEVLKETLFEFAANNVFQTIQDEVNQVEDPLERLSRGLRAFLSFHANRPRLYRTLLRSSLTPGTSLYSIRRKIIAKFSNFLATEVERAGREPIDPLTYEALLGAVEGTSINVLKGSGEVDPETIQRAHAVLMRVIGSTLALKDDEIPPLPAAGG
ncbi:MAG: TetR/AcrR family transcriptional regulator [Myxococcota bacterium]|nr:TetR/AcrR family transcriptional regulator [Myxococcota bacterium]